MVKGLRDLGMQGFRVKGLGDAAASAVIFHFIVHKFSSRYLNATEYACTSIYIYIHLSLYLSLSPSLYMNV